MMHVGLSWIEKEWEQEDTWKGDDSVGDLDETRKVRQFKEKMKVEDTQEKREQ